MPNTNPDHHNTIPTQGRGLTIGAMRAVRRHFEGWELSEHFCKRTGTISYVARPPYVHPNRREV